MIGRIVEIAEDGRYLARERGFMTVQTEGLEVGRVPLDDLSVVVATAHGLTYSNNLLVEFARRGIGFVICGSNHMPVAWLWPADAHHEQAGRIDAQLLASRPLRKRMWQAIVRAKIEQQAAVVERLGGTANAIRAMAARVRSGDTENLEAQAARRYWPMILGPTFRRTPRQGVGPNALLNYGYTILRAATARATMAAGLHPSIELHHSNRANSFRLVDDLMEPFRPLVDLAVVNSVTSGEIDLTPEVKKTLVGVLARDMATERGTSPVSTCLEYLALSVARGFETGEAELDLPIKPRPLELG